MYRNQRFGKGASPVNVGDEFDVKIEAVGEKGDGIAKKDGFVLFVPNTNIGDEVKISVTKILKTAGFAEVVGEGSAEKEESKEEPEPEEQEAEEKEETEDTEDFGEDLKE